MENCLTVKTTCISPSQYLFSNTYWWPVVWWCRRSSMWPSSQPLTSAAMSSSKTLSRPIVGDRQDSTNASISSGSVNTSIVRRWIECLLNTWSHPKCVCLQTSGTAGESKARSDGGGKTRSFGQS